jgi:hypothetical protein
MQTVTLDYDDPTIFAKCSGQCCRSYPGKKVGTYFGKAYTPRRWKRGPKCDNCSAPMVLLYEVSRE